ncbi:MAG: hypothetical protein IH949_01360 [Bacteroidetes bacterium]|nr:hypothetical protein [Bacteroidota bacterium]
MPPLSFIKPEKISLKNHPEYNEKWVQSIIAEDPSILGLGDLILRDKERPQPSAGRLDLLLQDADANRRYELEIQLGKTDESHIIRTIEYWDIEKRRYPKYDHCAVIVAEDITSRFSNIIGLFNGIIPLIAIQMNAIKFEDKISLIFTKVLDEFQRGFDEDEEVQVETDRAYWEEQGTKETLSIADKILEWIKEIDSQYEFKYNKFYIGLAKNGQPDNIVIFRAKKHNLRAEFRLNRTDEIDKKLEETNLDVMEYYSRDVRYRIRLKKTDINEHKEIIKWLLKSSYENSNT